MKNKVLALVLILALVCALSFSLVACNNDELGDLRFAAPQGTPALAMLRLVADNKELCGYNVNYEVVQPANIAAEMMSDKSDIVIMPVNAGANLIRQGKDYKLVSVAVDGSLYMVGKKQGGNTIELSDLGGKKIACIGQTGVPGLVFRYVMAHSGLEMISSGVPSANQVLVQYVADGPAARQLLLSNSVDFAVVGEPAATQFKGALQLNAEMDMQAAYAAVSPDNGSSYPQAGLFVRTSLANNSSFMDKLFEALAASKSWALANPDKITSFIKDNMAPYEAVFPAGSIPRCAINCARLTEDSKNKIVAFLKNVMPKDSEGNAINWDDAKGRIFG